MSRASGAVLMDLAFFAGASAETLERRGLRPITRHLSAAEDLFVVDDPRRHVWFATAGWLRIRVPSPGGVEATTALVGPGEIVACPGAFGRKTCQSTVTALTDATVLGVTVAAFEGWLRSDAEAACRLVAILDGRLREASRLKAINAERAVVRMRLTLAWLASKFGPEIPATRALLADITGLRAETCSRALSALSRGRTVRVSPGRVVVLRPDLLERGPGAR